MGQVLITSDELAEELKVTRSWIYSRTKEIKRSAGRHDCIPALKVGKYYRFVLGDVLNWLKNKQNG